PELEARTLRYIEEARAAALSTVLPDPLDDSAKCNGCSLNGICLPDETLRYSQKLWNAWLDGMKKGGVYFRVSPTHEHPAGRRGGRRRHPCSSYPRTPPPCKRGR